MYHLVAVLVMLWTTAISINIQFDQQITVPQSTSACQVNFGFGTALSGHNMAIGCSKSSPGSAVFMYQKQATGWELTQTIPGIESAVVNGTLYPVAFFGANM